MTVPSRSRYLVRTHVVRIPRQLMRGVFWLLVTPLSLTLSILLYPWRRLMTRLARRPADETIPVYRVNVVELRSILACGISEIEAHRPYLNRINVYPVADGDTGSNMVHTLAAVGDALSSHPKDFSALSKVASSAALLHARGNSGIIMAQYLAGFLGTFEGVKRRISGVLLTRALFMASQQAREAIDQPIDGTMLDVFEAAAEGASAKLRESGDWVELLDAALDSARVALERTKSVLPAMQNANVVDAGGAGFLFFLAGCLTQLKRRQVVVTETHPGREIVMSEVPDIEFRYCTEAVVRGSQASLVNLKIALAALGNSLNVVVSQSFTKIHIHTNEPERIRALLAAQGTIEDWKVDDMKFMQKVHVASIVTAGQRQKAQLGIVVDSSMDIPDHWPESVPLFVIPLPVAVDDFPMGFADNMPLGEFYQRMAGDAAFIPRTSQPSPEQCHTIIQAAMEEAEQVVCLSLSAALSGTYSVVSQVVQAAGSESVHAVDTETASAGIAILAEWGVDHFLSTGSLSTMIQGIYDRRSELSIYFLVQNLAFLERGGRISKAQSILGQILGIQPLLTIRGGRVEKTPTKLRYPSEEKRLVLLYDKIAECAVERPLRYVYVMHANAEQAAKKLAARVAEDFGIQPRVAELNRVMGAHVGPGTLAVGVL